MSRILVVDDSPSTLDAVTVMLESAGHQVCCCPDGKCAQRVLEREAFDLIVTDIFMPEEDGLEIIRVARRLRPQLPIVAMSGMGGTLDMLSVAKRLGACQLLRKPFSSTDLLVALRTALATPDCASEHRP